MAEVDGYSKLAIMMSRSDELCIFRCFKELNLKNLLFLQAELTKLESELSEIINTDNVPGNIRQYFDKHWPLLSDTHPEGLSEQWTKMLEIRRVLREYNECLAHQVNLAKLGRPHRYHLGILRDWLVRPSMGYFPIISKDRDAWGETMEYDLVALSDQSGDSPFNSFMSERIVPIYHYLLGHLYREPIPWDPKSGIALYSNETISLLLNVLGTAISCLFPVATIVALYYVKSMGVRLGMTAAFTGALSIFLSLMTNARRIEIFAATSAFAAVLVVFLGSNNAVNT